MSHPCTHQLLHPSLFRHRVTTVSISNFSIEIKAACSETPCQNNATCIDGISGPVCKCLQGFTGSKCEVNINECASNPCFFNGACTDGINAYFCKCKDGFVGETIFYIFIETISNPSYNWLLKFIIIITSI